MIALYKNGDFVQYSGEVNKNPEQILRVAKIYDGFIENWYDLETLPVFGEINQMCTMYVSCEEKEMNLAYEQN